MIARQASSTLETSPAVGAADAAPTIANGTARPTKATLSRLNETLLMTFPSATLTPSPRSTRRQPPDRCSPDASDTPSALYILMARRETPSTGQVAGCVGPDSRTFA